MVFAKKKFDGAHGGLLGSIAELSPGEYKVCLDATNEELKNKSKQEFVERDRGPGSPADRGLGVYTYESAGRIALEDYNGKAGGQVHR